MKGVGKFFIIINEYRYRYIKSNCDKDKGQCEHFIKYKTGQKICWDDIGKENSYRYFYLDGVLHREDGPAFIMTNLGTGYIYTQWYMDGNEMSFEERTNQIRKINLEFCLDE